MSTVYLVCKQCRTKEGWTEGSVPQPCACGAPRYAEDENGAPMVMWSSTGNLTDWRGE